MESIKTYRLYNDQGMWIDNLVASTLTDARWEFKQKWNWRKGYKISASLSKNEIRFDNNVELKNGQYFCNLLGDLT